MNSVGKPEGANLQIPVSTNGESAAQIKARLAIEGLEAVKVIRAGLWGKERLERLG
jgi:hypothetical protein